MKFPFCSHEERVAELGSNNSWPRSADSALLAHAGKCRRCSDVLSTVQTLRQGRFAAMLAAHAPSPDYLWWRAQLSRRSSMLEQVTKPLLWAEKAALICMVFLAGGFAFWQWEQLKECTRWLGGIFDSNTLRLDPLLLHSLPEGSLIRYSLLGGLLAIVCISGLTLLLLDGKADRQRKGPYRP